MENYLDYVIVIEQDCDFGWGYEVYSDLECTQLHLKSIEWFEAKEEARHAAIGHITLMEQGVLYD